MLIGRDDISNDISTLGLCLSMFVYILACFYFMLIGGDLTAQLTESHREMEFKFQRQLQALLPFLAPPPEHPRELAWLSSADSKVQTTSHLRSEEIIKHTY